MRIIFSFLLLLLFSNLVFAQKNTIDSLQEFNYTQLKEKFYEKYDNDKTKEAKAIAHYYLAKAKKNKDNNNIAEGYILTHFNADFPTALKYLDSVSAVTKNIKGDVYPARVDLLKGNAFYKYDNLKSALDYYILGLKHARIQNNKNQVAYADMNIAYLNTYLGKNTEAAKTFRHYLYNTNYLKEFDYKQLNVTLAHSYIELNKLDSANILIKQGLESAIAEKNKYAQSQYQYLSGNYDIKRKDYKSAVKNLNLAEEYFSGIHDMNTNLVLYSLGKAYDALGQKDKAIHSYIKLDSLVQKTGYIFPELKEAYTYIIDYYKGKNNTEKQLYYIERFLKINQKLDEQFRYLSVELPKKYDTPNLLKEKQNIIDSLNRKKIFSFTAIGSMTVLLLILLILFYRSKKAEKTYRKTAQELIHSLEERHREKNKTEIQEVETSIVQDNTVNPVEIFNIKETIQPEAEEKLTKNVPEDVKVTILKGLDNFEKKENFLKKGITLSTLSKSINTNTTYLSEVINTHKEKNFTNYINDLRIDYVLERLIHDKKFRSYKLPAIAEELGYNNVQAFSLAFKKKTETTPSIYIKEIENSLIS